MSRAPGRRQGSITRRRVLGAALTAGVAGLAWGPLRRGRGEPVVILKAMTYDGLEDAIRRGFAEIGVGPPAVARKNVVLKPNLVEPSRGAGHVNTHPQLVLAAIRVFRSLGAASVVVAEGAGHVRDPYFVLEESGLLPLLADDRAPFVDLNFDPAVATPNQGRWTKMTHLMLPRTILHADVLVSLGKMKTHHWAGVTLSMKNLFGLMPGAYYGWPKNVLHEHGLLGSILDINATVRPHLAIVDGVVGMGGDGPILGDPVSSGVLVMGTNLTAVDATCARIMGIAPESVQYLDRASGVLGPIEEGRIVQRGEAIASIRMDYPLLDHIPAHASLERYR